MLRFGHVGCVILADVFIRLIGIDNNGYENNGKDNATDLNESHHINQITTKRSQLWLGSAVNHSSALGYFSVPFIRAVCYPN